MTRDSESSIKADNVPLDFVSRDLRSRKHFRRFIYHKARNDRSRRRVKTRLVYGTSDICMVATRRRGKEMSAYTTNLPPREVSEQCGWCMPSFSVDLEGAIWIAVNVGNARTVSANNGVSYL